MRVGMCLEGGQMCEGGKVSPFWGVLHSMWYIRGVQFASNLLDIQS